MTTRIRSGRLPAAFLAGLFLFFACAGPAAAGRLALEHDLSAAAASAHTGWGKPWADGPARVLFLMPHYEGRLAVELAQRFDLAAAAAYHDDRSRADAWLGGEGGRARLDGLLEQEWDAFFINQLSPDQVGTAAGEKIIAAVGRGAGLVARDAEGWRELLEGARPVRPGPPALPAGCEALALESGRVALLGAPAPLEYDFSWPVILDHRFEGYGRALFWAAGRAPGTLLEISVPDLSAGGPALPRDALSDTPVTLSWKDAPADARGRLEIRRVDGWRARLWEGRCPGTGTAPAALPALRAGSYFLEARVETAAGVAAWATAPLEVSAARAPAALELERDWGEPGEQLAGRVRLEGAPLAGESLQIGLFDRSGRLLVRRALEPSADGETGFSVTLEDWLPMLIRVEALLLSGGEEVAAREAYFNVTRRGRDHFNFVTWFSPRGELAPLGYEALARAGVTAVLGRGTPSRAMAAAGLSFLPYATWLGAEFSTLTGSLGRDGIMRARGGGRYGCYNDHENFDSYVAGVVESQLPSRRHGVLAYSIGDESAVRGSCLSEQCLEAYRAYLAMKYGGEIAALNESWGSAYAAFDEIRLLEPEQIPAPDAPEWFREWYEDRVEFLRTRYPTRHRPAHVPMDEATIRFGDINDELGALQAGNFARWYDRQAFQTWNLVQAAKRFHDAFREIDPLGLTGFEGTNSFAIPRSPTRIRQGGDIDLIVRELGWWGPYAGLANEVIRSIAPREFPTSNFIGYFPDQREINRYWNVVLSGMQHVKFYATNTHGRFLGLISPHYEPYPARREMLEDTRITREGLGDWLIGAGRVDDRIAVFYSLPSTYISNFDGNEEYGAFGLHRGVYEDQHRAWVGTLRRLGLEFRYVTDRQLRLGEFDPDAFDVLILPLALALDEREAAVIRDFVRGGGTVIADVRTGTYSGRCRPLSSGLLDEVFGISRLEKAAARPALLSLDAEHRGRRLRLDGKETRVDPAVRLAGGTALGRHGEVPVLVHNEYGAGRSWFLNFTFGGIHAPMRPLLRELFADAGLERRVRFEDVGDPLPFVRGMTNASVRVVAGDEEEDNYLEITLFPEPPDGDGEAAATAELTAFPVRDWTHYDQVMIEADTGGAAPEGRLEVRFYNRGARASSEALRIGSADGWRAIERELGGAGREDVRWLRVMARRGWSGEKPFVLRLRGLRLLRSAADVMTDQPDEEARAPYLDIPLFAESRAATVTRFRDGGVELLALRPMSDEELPLRVTLPEVKHVYCLRTGEALGPVREFRAELARWPNLYALLDRPAPAPRLSGPGAAARGGRARVEVRLPGAAGNHPVRLRLRDPSGREAEWFAPPLVVGDEPREVTVPLAYNDPPGEWTLEAVELFSGAAAVMTLTVE